MTRVLVCGGRDYGISPEQKQALIAELDAACRKDRFTAIIEGGAPGADAGARVFADLWGIPLITMRADWLAHGRAAGPIRNQRMIDEGKPDLVIAFPGGRGTADMVRRARAAGIEVREISPRPQHGGGAE